MIAYIFPGQGSQFSGMGKDLYEGSQEVRALFDQAKSELGFDIGEVMFHGTEEELKQTNVTQPAIFLHSCAVWLANPNRAAAAYFAGHSLGEFSGLVASGVVSFAEGIYMVKHRANEMQKACVLHPSSMAAVLGLSDEITENICNQAKEIVVPANYNSPGQIVISGSFEGIAEVTPLLQAAGAKRVLPLPVGGAFHSPLMKPALEGFKLAIENINFKTPRSPIVQNITAKPVSDPEQIKENIIAQLTGPVKWSQSIAEMAKLGVTSYIEVGPGKVLQGLVKKIQPEAEIAGL